MNASSISSYTGSGTYAAASSCAPIQRLVAPLAAMFSSVMLAGSLAEAAVQLQVQVNPGSAAPNDSALVEIAVANDGPTPQTDLAVTLVFPDRAASLAETLIEGPFNAAASCASLGFSSSCEPGEVLRWDLGTINPGRIVLLSLPATVASGAIEGQVIDWEATAFNDASDLATASAALVVAGAAPPLTLAIAEDRDPVPAGDLLLLDLSYGNASTASVTNASLALTLPDDVTFVSASAGGVENAGVVTWNLGTLAAGVTGERTVTVQANAVAAGRLLASAAQISGTQNFAGTTRTAAETGRIGPQGPLSMALQVNPQPNDIDRSALVEMVVSNPTPTPVFGALLQLRYPDGVASRAETLIEGPFDAPSSCAEAGFSASCEAFEFLRWPLGTINPGQAVIASLPAALLGAIDSGDVIAWDAQLTDDSGALTQEAFSLAIADAPPLSLSLDDSRDPLPAGASGLLTVRYGNTSGASVTDATLSLTLPPGTAFVSASGGASEVNGVVSWNLGTLASGASGRQDVEVTADPLAAGTLLESHARIEGTQNFAATVREVFEIGRVGPRSALSMALQADPSPIDPAEDALFTVTLTNDTLTPVFGANVRLRYPNGAASVDEDLMDGPYEAANSCAEDGFSASCEAFEFLNWQVGTLNPGQAALLSLPVALAGGVAPGALIGWEAQLRDDSGTLTLESQTLVVSDMPPLTLTVADAADPVPAAQTTTLVLSYGNRSANSVTDATLSLDLADGLAFLTATGGGVEVDGTVSWNLGTLAAGSVGEQRVLVQAASVMSGTLLQSDARIAGAQNFQAVVREVSEIGRVGPQGALRLALQSNSRPLDPGGDGLVDLTVTNASLSPVFGAAARLRYPAGVASLDEGFIGGPFDAVGSCAEAGFSASCEAFEFLNWPIGTLNPGQTALISLPTSLLGSIDAGALVDWEAQLRDDSGALTLESQALPLVQAPPLALGIDDVRDPLPAGQSTTLRVRYGNRSVTSVTDASLTLELPPEVTFLSATEGGVAADGVVTWPLGTLSAGAIGQRVVEVLAGPLNAGTLLESHARISATQGFAMTERDASEIGRIGPEAPLAMDLSVSPVPAQGGDTVSVELSVTNTLLTPVLGGQVILRYPDGANSLAEGDIGGPFDGAGSCFEGGFSSSCESFEFLRWQFDLGPGERIQLSLPPQLSNLADGNLINWEAALTDDDSGVVTLETTTLPLGVDFDDTDGDGVGAFFDNCLLVANPRQLDTDGDGYGNACDPDIAAPNDCVVNFLDLGVLKSAFFATPESADWEPDADFNSDGVINFLDLGTMRNLFFSRPGPSAASQACDP
ncbi:MAG: hypothetical protein AAGA68_22485 [Pseudomonadota bacterium]